MLKYSITKYYLGVFIPLVISGFICLLFRTPNSFGNVFFDEFFHINIHQNLSVNYLILYNLPSALWVFSSTLLSLDYNVKVNKEYRLQLIYLPLYFIVGLELLQLLKITDGTFDVLDIIIPFLTWYVAYYLLRNNTIHSKKKYKLLKIAFFSLSFLILFLADVKA